MEPVGAGAWMLLIVTLAAATAAAHNPEVIVPAAPDETLRILSVVSLTANDTTAHMHGKTPGEGGLGLSFAPLSTASRQHTYRFVDPARVLVCLPPNEPYCGRPTTVRDSAALANKTEDLPLEWQDSYSGRFVVEWKYQAHGPVSFNSQPNGMLSITLSVGGTDYGSIYRGINGPSGRLVLEGDFQRQFQCAPAEGGHAHGNGSECSDDFNETRPELWAHDIAIGVDISIYGSPSITTGSELKVSLATAGSSYVAVHERVAPPPGPVEAVEEPTAAPTPILLEVRGAEGEPQAVLPAPSAGWAILAAAAAGLCLRRRG